MTPKFQLSLHGRHVETDGGGKGNESGIGERQAFFSPPPPHNPFFLRQRPRLRYKRKRKREKNRQKRA